MTGGKDGHGQNEYEQPAGRASGVRHPEVSLQYSRPTRHGDGHEAADPDHHDLHATFGADGVGRRELSTYAIRKSAGFWRFAGLAGCRAPRNVDLVQEPQVDVVEV